ncbi:store-operated calcium entry regulator STIMATE [Ixodes scapularis]|uniref:Putative conserved plasma membrane protein n=1 Tax=Ixodes scapularis TaxID=6945 RepID=A0A4D5S0N3_IXOSC|nr:store-operated calcium entry regulator STIMATE [Ixodes scapularis]
MTLGTALTTAGTWSSTAAAAAAPGAGDVIDNFGAIVDDDGVHCRHGALTNSFGWFVQGILAVLAFACLILKRFCEPRRHRRPWIIWFYDTSKQGVGALVIHFANVFLAEFFQGDPCTWYIVSFLLDSSVGLAFIFAGIRLTQHVSRRRGWNLLVFGEYGKPPDKRAWLAQGALYVLLMLCEKALSTLVVQLPFWDQVRLFIMSPIHNPKVEVALVVLVIPFFVNVLIFWVTDNFLMQHHPRLNGRNGSVNKKNPPKSSALRRSWVHPADEEPASWPECEGLLSGEERPGALS